MTEITFRKCYAAAGNVEATIERRGYASRGLYRVEVTGLGFSQAEAAASLQAMLVEASAGVSLEIDQSLKWQGREATA